MVDWRRYDRSSLPRLPKGLLYAGNFSVGDCLDGLRNGLRDSAKPGTLRKRVAHVADYREGQKNGGLFHHRRLPSGPGRNLHEFCFLYAITSSVEEPGAKSHE